MRYVLRTWGLLPALYMVMGVGVATAAETLGQAVVAGGAEPSVNVQTATGAIIHVDAGATGGNDGSSWCDAYRNPQDALSAATPGDTILVAQGTYMPDGGYTPVGGTHAPGDADRTATFQLVTGVTLQGGYAGCGQPDPDERDVNAFETILSGDLVDDDTPAACTQDSDCIVIIGRFVFPRMCADDGFCIIADNNNENSYHVVTGSSTDGPAILDGFTITAGNANGSFPNDGGGGMYNFINCNPAVTNCTFSGNSAVNFGGGMYNFINSNPAVTNCTFSRNSAGTGGGGMANGISAPTVTNCTFRSNSGGAGASFTGRGGGMYNADSTAAVTNCTFSDNSAFFGGGMYNRDGSSPALTECTFTGNAASLGGGMYNNFESSPMVTNCTFSGNSAVDSGGGMYNYNSTPKVTTCTFSGNAAAQGGGMFNTDTSSPALTDCTFSGNTADDGGGMFNNFSSPVVTDCTYSGNSANSGGGMYNFGGSAAVTGCTFNGNSADEGGGMFNEFSSPVVTNCRFGGNFVNLGGGMHNTTGSSPTVTNCTFSTNFALSGGGIYNTFSSSPAVTNCTVWGNHAFSSGGGMFNNFSDPTVANCILSGNFPTQIVTFSGTPVVNYSIVQGGWIGAGGVGVVDADPLFVDPDGPDDVFGTEDDDLRLMPGSPAIDAGSNAAVPPDGRDLDGDGDTGEPTPLDLDGNPRFVDVPRSPDCPHGGDCGTAPIVDMGAFEFACEFSGDSDGDADVDLDDFLEFLDCAADAPAPTCTDFDADCDGDVNLFDFGRFQRAFTGP